MGADESPANGGEIAVATYTLAPSPWLIFLDDDGVIVPDGQLAIYAAGTTTPATVYKTSSGTAHAFPIDLNGFGRVPDGLYLVPGSSYKFVLHLPMVTVDLDGAIVKTQDNIAAIPLSASNLDVTGTLGENGTAGDAFYLSDGSGGTVAGQWYHTDADLSYASIFPVVAFLVADALSGATAILRAGGLLTVTGPLQPGARYYVGAVAGTIATTSPPMSRLVGQAQSTTVLNITANPAPMLQGDRAPIILGSQVFG